MNSQTPDNEVARLTCSICEKQHDYSYEECLIKESGRSIVGELKELNNEVERLNGEVMKGARILATIVDALEQAVPWIKATLNPTEK